jgi:uncharacterized protein YycO
MRIALYQGVGGLSRAIRFLTRSKYSHAAFLLNDNTVIEAWTDGGVRHVANLSVRHTPGTVVDIYQYDTPLSPREEDVLLNFLHEQLGKDYDFSHVLRFVTRRPGKEDTTEWFCSELVDAASNAVKRVLFKETKSWEVSPGLLPRSLALKFSESVVTT